MRTCDRTVWSGTGTVRKDFKDGLRRFRDAGRMQVGFTSFPSIVSCQCFFRASGTAYLGMLCEDGQSLAGFPVRREAEVHPFTEADLLAVMLPLLDCLVGVHAAGVLHLGTNHRTS